MPKALLQRADLAAHLDAKLGIEIGERLVHQAHRGFRYDRTSQRDALLLAARQLRWSAVEKFLEAEDIRGARKPRTAVCGRDLADLEPEHDVFRD